MATNTLTYFILSCCSLLGSLCFLFSLIRYRAAVWAVLVGLAAADLILSVHAIFCFSGAVFDVAPLREGDPSCAASFFFNTFAVSAVAMWELMLGISNLILLVWWESDRVWTYSNRYMHLVVWTYSASVSIYPLFVGGYGPIEGPGNYCYFPDPQDLNRLTVYGVLGAALFFDIGLLCYVLLAYLFSWGAFSRANKTNKVLIVRLCFVLITFIGMFGVVFVERIRDLATGFNHTDIPWISWPLSGFCNFTVWGVSQYTVEIYEWVKFRCYLPIQSPRPKTTETGYIEIN